MSSTPGSESRGSAAAPQQQQQQSPAAGGRPPAEVLGAWMASTPLATRLVTYLNIGVFVFAFFTVGWVKRSCISGNWIFNELECTSDARRPPALSIGARSPC